MADMDFKSIIALFIAVGVVGIILFSVVNDIAVSGTTTTGTTQTGIVFATATNLTNFPVISGTVIVRGFAANLTLVEGQNYTLTIPTGTALERDAPSTLTINNTAENASSVYSAEYRYEQTGYITSPLTRTLIILIPVLVAVLLLIFLVTKIT